MQRPVLGDEQGQEQRLRARGGRQTGRVAALHLVQARIPGCGSLALTGCCSQHSAHKADGIRCCARPLSILFFPLRSADPPEHWRFRTRHRSATPAAGVRETFHGAASARPIAGPALPTARGRHSGVSPELHQLRRPIYQPRRRPLLRIAIALLRSSLGTFSSPVHCRRRLLSCNWPHTFFVLPTRYPVVSTATRPTDLPTFSTTTLLHDCLYYSGI